jgi:hypothetical protein
MRLKEVEKHLFIKQMELLDLGMAVGPGLLADEFTAKAQSAPASQMSSIIEVIDRRFAQLAATVEEKGTCEVKHVVAQRNELVTWMFNYAGKSHAKCTSCKVPRRRIRTHQQNKVFFASGTKKPDAKKAVQVKKKQKELFR